MPKANPAALRYIVQRYSEGYYDDIYEDEGEDMYAGDTTSEEEAQSKKA